MDLLNQILEKRSIQDVSNELNLSKSTVQRWIELNHIPPQYEFDLYKMLDQKIDYSKYSSKEKDQFFTPQKTAKHCYELFKKVIEKYGEKEEEYMYIEPSAGDGSFMKVLPQDRVIGMDIEPRGDHIKEQDYLEWKPQEKKDQKYVVMGNPPFGLRGHMALRFINHSYEFADYVAFILPQLFESDGKGVPRKRVKGYHLLYSEKMESHFYEPPENKEVKINTIFQIWSKHHHEESLSVKVASSTHVKVYSLSDGGSPSTTRNKKMIGKCDLYIPSTCFGKEKMKIYETFEELPGKKGYGILFLSEEKKKMAYEMDWGSVAFMSTNSAYNLRTSQIYNVFS